jgi:hypothetical protein
VNRQFSNGFRDVRIVLRQAVSRIEFDVPAVLKRQHPDPIQLSLEQPFRPRESLLGERRAMGTSQSGKGSPHMLIS